MNKAQISDYLLSQIPGNEIPCLCGSGMKFGRCCRENISLIDKNPKRTQSDQSFLKIARAKITRYTIWHRKNTLLLIKTVPDLGRQYMKHDLAAMSDFVRTLLSAHMEVSKIDLFLPTLERLRNNISDERWQRKITYFQAFTLSLDEANGDLARAEFLKLAPMEDEEDIETLQLYLDLFGETLSFGSRQNIIGKILSGSEEPGDRLQYECLSAMDYFLIGDRESAKKLLTQALANYHALPTSFIPDLNTLRRYAGVLELDGNLNDNAESTSKSIEVFRSLSDHPNLNDSGKADILRQLGELYRSRERYESALECFIKSIELEPSGICQVFLASSLISIGDLDKARDILQCMGVNELTYNEDIDYVFTWYELTSRSKQKQDAAYALDLLKKVKIEVPYFSQMKDEMIIALMELQAGVGGKLNATIWQKLEGLTRYISLKPGMFGVSVDLNKIITEQSKKTKNNL